jgi:hypothetical protein
MLIVNDLLTHQCKLSSEKEENTAATEEKEEKN